MNKKSIELTMNTIVIAMIVLIVALVIIFMFNHYYGKETGIIKGQIEKLEKNQGDSDGDGILDIYDKCPNNPDPNCKSETK